MSCYISKSFDDYSKDDNCLTDAGYDSRCADESVRREALRKAVASVCLPRVLYRLRFLASHNCHLNVFRDIVWMTSDAYPLSFRAFGFSMLSDDKVRCCAVSVAAGVYGLSEVYKRIELITSRRCVDQHHRAAWTRVVKFLVANNDEAKHIDIPTALKQMIADALPISLREYHYSMATHAHYRQHALLNAINERGVAVVLNRLMEVAVHHQKGPYKQNVDEDILFVQQRITK